MNLVETIRNTIECHGLIPDGTTVVAAVSGGADSVALLHALHRLGFPVTIAHLNHQLRGRDSDEDEAFVCQLAAELDLPFTVNSVDVRTQAASEGLSIEMAARQARHDFFAEFGDTTVALAHHADDQVETFILKLARGAGTEGLGGMAYRQQMGNLQLIRPMLDLSRNDILAWLAEHRLEWREDASNADETYLRNRVRHSILPRLEQELNPNIRETLLRTMDILREEDEWMTEAVAGIGPNDAKDLPLAARRRILRKWLFEQGATEAGFDAVGSILLLMDKGNGSTVHELNDRKRVVIEYGRLRFEDDDRPAQDPSWNLILEPGYGWKRDHGRGVGILPAEASFDADKVGDSPITVRTFQPGDRIEPMGMEGSRKLQDIFTDQKLPRTLRSAVPVVVCRGEIIWLPGYRTARSWAVQGEHGNSLHVRIEQKTAD